MIKIIKTSLFCLLFAAQSALPMQTSQKINMPEPKKYDRKIRAGYMAASNQDLIPEMAKNGMNTALVKFGSMHTPLLPKEKQLLEQWANACKKEGINFIPVINFWHHEKNWIKPKYHLYYTQTEFSNTPCPLDSYFYNLVINKRLEELAKLSKSIPIAGAAIDLEMYSADMGRFPEYCLCDNCFEKFLKNKTVDSPIPKNQRQKYLEEKKLIPAYREFTKSTIEKMAENTKKTIESIAPDFMIGGLNLDIGYYYNLGFTQGLASGLNPLLVYSERTYTTGYNEYIKQTQKRYSNNNINAKFIPGIWQFKFNPADLAAQYYHCAKDSAGYWVYGLQYLSQNQTQSLPAQKKSYWQAIKEANSELDKLETAAGYKSNLKIKTTAAPPPELDTSDIKLKKNLTRCKSEKSAQKIENLDIYFRKKMTFVFTAKKNDQIYFEIALRKIGKHNLESAHIALTNYNGNILAQSLVTKDKKAVIKNTALYDGSYTIACNASYNAIRIVSCSHPFSIDTNKKVNLFKPQESMFLYRPATNLEAKIRLEVDGMGESVTVLFKKDGQTIGRHDIISKQIISIPLENYKEQIIELEVLKRGRYFEDLRIQIMSGLSRFISPTINGLLK